MRPGSIVCRVNQAMASMKCGGTMCCTWQCSVVVQVVSTFSEPFGPQEFTGFVHAVIPENPYPMHNDSDKGLLGCEQRWLFRVRPAVKVRGSLVLLGHVQLHRQVVTVQTFA